MSADRDISEVILDAWTTLLRRQGVRHPRQTAIEQLGIAKLHGAKFSVPPHWHDPNADHRNRPEPGDQEAGVLTALAAIGKGLCTECGDRVHLDENSRIGPHEISDDGHPPFRPCPGGAKPPRGAAAGDQEQEPNHEH